MGFLCGKREEESRALDREEQDGRRAVSRILVEAEMLRPGKRVQVKWKEAKEN